MARHHAPRTPPGGRSAGLRLTHASVAVTTLAVAAALAGCGDPGPSSCSPPADEPAAVSGPGSREPAVAADGVGGAVVAWADARGEGVGAAVRAAEGAWEPSRRLSTGGAVRPTAAMGPDGGALVAWEHRPVGGSPRVQAAGRDGAGWTAPVTLSGGGGAARMPHAAAEARGGALVAWIREGDGGTGRVQVARRGPDGGWDRPETISESQPGVTRVRLAVGADGTAVAVWHARVGGTGTVLAARRRADGAWDAPSVVSNGLPGAAAPDVAVDPQGRATAVWVGESPGGVAVFASDLAPGAPGWSRPHALAHGDGAPREVPRPGRAEAGADVAALPDGGAVAVWTVHTGGADVVGTASRREGTWGPPSRLSRGRVGGGAQVAPLGGAGAVAVFEEVDGGLLRARAVRIGPDGRGAGCRDLSRRRTETAGPRVAGGVVPVVVVEDLGRGRILVAEPG